MTITSNADTVNYLRGTGNLATAEVVVAVNADGTSTSTRSSTIATNQATVATTATLIAAARTGRVSITIINGGTTDVLVGGSGVTTANGLLLTGTKGASVTINTSAAVYGIVGTGTQAVSYLEAY